MRSSDGLRVGSFVEACGLPLRLMSQELARMAQRVRDALPGLSAFAAQRVVDAGDVEAVSEVVRSSCEAQLRIAPLVRRWRESDV